MEQPLKLTAPSASAPEHPDKVPGPPALGVPPLIANVTVEESVVTGSPLASSTLTWGWPAQVLPAAPPPGCWVNTR